MVNAQHEVEGYVSHIVFPASKEELVNGLLVRNAPARMVALVERLPGDRYDSLAHLREDLKEVSRVHAREVKEARTYEDFLTVVLRHVGDVRHTTKEAYNRVVAHVIHIAQQQGTLGAAEARAMEQRLEAAFADLRGTMSQVYDDLAPVDPYRDLPQTHPESSGASMLTHVDIDHFKQHLQAHQTELQQRIAALNQDLASPEQWVEAEDERSDDAVFLRNRDDDWDRLAFAQAELALVEKALARIEAGTYGISEVSGKPIPRERLEADPAATTLVGETHGGVS